MLNELRLFDFDGFFVANVVCHNWLLDKIVNYTISDSLFQLGVMMAYCWFWFVPTSHVRLSNRVTMVGILFGTPLGLMLARGLAATLPFRVRPMYEYSKIYHLPSLAIPRVAENWSSFPSDHAVVLFCVAFGLYRISRPVGLAAMAVAAWQCLSLLYLGIHYPTDLMAGALLGICVAAGSVTVLKARGGILGQRLMRSLQKIEDRYPQAFYTVVFALAFETAVMFNDLRDLFHGTIKLMQQLGYAHADESSVFFIMVGMTCAVGFVLWLSVLHNRSRAPHRRDIARPEMDGEGRDPEAGVKY